MGNSFLKSLNKTQMGGSHANTNEGESTKTIQANKQNNSQSYNNEFGSNNIQTKSVGAGGSVFLAQLNQETGVIQLQQLGQLQTAQPQQLWSMFDGDKVSVIGL